jgi:hypothetical protein
MWSGGQMVKTLGCCGQKRWKFKPHFGLVFKTSSWLPIIWFADLKKNSIVKSQVLCNLGFIHSLIGKTFKEIKWFKNYILVEILINLIFLLLDGNYHHKITFNEKLIKINCRTEFQWKEMLIVVV